MKKHFESSQIVEMDSFYRRNLINCLSGYKSLNLIGTRGLNGETNLAPFSQVFHIGANPPLVGIIFRPHTVKRDTLENILATGSFTLNHVTADFFVQAHWTAANWEGSEFDGTGIEAEFHHDFHAPFVKNSPVQIACELVENTTLKANETVFLIGRIVEVFVEENGLRDDGSLDLQVFQTVTVAGLDDYYLGERLGRLEYPRPHIRPEKI